MDGLLVMLFQVVVELVGGAARGVGGVVTPSVSSSQWDPQPEHAEQVEVIHLQVERVALHEQMEMRKMRDSWRA